MGVCVCVHRESKQNKSWLKKDRDTKKDGDTKKQQNTLTPIQLCRRTQKKQRQPQNKKQTKDLTTYQLLLRNEKTKKTETILKKTLMKKNT